METNASTSTFYPRSPKVASRLSDLSYGLGQIYCGRFVRGLVIYVIGMAMLVAWIMLIALMKGRFLEALLIGAIPATALWLFAKFDARRLAAKAPADYALKEYNSWYVYAMLIFIGISVAICGAFFVRATAYEAFHVISDRMAPTIPAGRRVLVNKTIYDVEPMQCGDVVIILSPNRLRTNQVQRLVALPGDKVESSGNDVVVNGAAVVRPGKPPSTRPATQPADKAVERTMPPGHGFFISDNPDAGLGDLGEVPLSSVVGRVVCIYWPRPARVR